MRLGTCRFPARSTYVDRSERVHRLFPCDIKPHDAEAIGEGICDAKTVAVDKSMLAARGPLWHKSDRKKKRFPERLRGIDRESDWGCPKHDGWVQGYSFEVVVSATKNSTVFPLLAWADTASVKETNMFAEKLHNVPETIKRVTADCGYNSNRVGERVEWREDGRRTGRRFLRSENTQGRKRQPRNKKSELRNESVAGAWLVASSRRAREER